MKTEIKLWFLQYNKCKIRRACVGNKMVYAGSTVQDKSDHKGWTVKIGIPFLETYHVLIKELV
jgi:antirestriction protein ArdC